MGNYSEHEHLAAQPIMDAVHDRVKADMALEKSWKQEELKHGADSAALAAAREQHNTLKFKVEQDIIGRFAGNVDDEIAYFEAYNKHAASVRQGLEAVEAAAHAAIGNATLGSSAGTTKGQAAPEIEEKFLASTEKSAEKPAILAKILQLAANNPRVTAVGAASLAAGTMLLSGNEKDNSAEPPKSGMFKKAVVGLGLTIAAGAALHEFGPAATKGWLERTAKSVASGGASR